MPVPVTIYDLVTAISGVDDEGVDSVPLPECGTESVVDAADAGSTDA
jgi:hypothetical protein